MGICGSKESAPPPPPPPRNADREYTNNKTANNKTATIGYEPPPSATDIIQKHPKAKFADVYKIGKELGSGAFSVVKEGSNKSTGESFAIKIVTKSKLTEEDESALMEEIDVLKDMQHPNIIRLYETFDEKDFYYLVTEKMLGGELFDRIVQKSYYNEKEARDTCRVLFDAIKYCHSKKVAHRDLKPENLLLQSASNDSKVKIADFGFAKRCPRPMCLTTQCGTPGYVAPEILEGVPYDTQSDMWSLGVIVYILLGGYPPFIEQNQRELFRKIRKGQFEFHEEYWGQVSQDAKNLIKSLLTVDPNKRANAPKILESRWMSAEDDYLMSQDLGLNLQEFKRFNAKRKLRAAVSTIIATQKLTSLGMDFKKSLQG
uniref:non-specific serine/threonine protein kinase n=1 Tax=Amphora coffeiformis TaxID=265554 RepID=A0A7S3L7C7_9STRA|mmetsp:Transcript_12672/g.24363  ORF Transcript_12672/g.24363 Transcript_12672/m.24363 type:complete len:373 (+) Transcript_12672:93-1211(+)